MIEGKDYKIIREPHYSKLIINEGVTEIDNNKFEFYLFNEIILPSTLKRIGRNAFNSNHELKEIIIPNSVEYIGPYAFYGCTHLESITLPNGITTINSGTFEYTNLKTIIIPNGVKVIADNAFYVLSSEDNITIDLPPSIEILGSLAFRNTNWKINLNSNIKYVMNNSVCNKEYKELLENSKQNFINFLEPVKGIYINIDNYANALTDNKTLISNKSLSKTYTLSKGELTINDGVIIVGDFSNLNIKKINLPKSVKYILPNAFSKNIIESLDFSRGIIYIGNRAFENAHFNQKNINIGSSLMLIEREAFPSNLILNISDSCSCDHANVSFIKSKKGKSIVEPIKESPVEQTSDIDNFSIIEELFEKDESILKHYGYQRNMLEINKNSIEKVDVNTANEKAKQLFDLIKNNELDNLNVDLFASYIKEGASMYYYDNELDVSLFELLIRKNHVMLICVLFNYGYYFDIYDSEFIKIFFLSAKIENTNILELFLILGVNPNITDNNRDTALNYAIKSKNINSIKMLLDRGAAIGITNIDNKSAVDLARETNDKNIIAIIEEINNNIKENNIPEEEEINEEELKAEAEADLLILSKLLKGGGK